MSTLTINDQLYLRLNTGVRVRKNFDRWFLYRTSRYDRYEINDIALMIIRLCDGSRTIGQIIETLEAEDVDVESTAEFLRFVVDESIVLTDTQFVHSVEVPVYEDTGPSWTVLHITNRCNLTCRHCYVDAKSNIVGELTYPEILACIEQLKDLGVIDVIFTGGEPFYRQDFLPMLRYTASLGISSEILTNGTLIDERIASELASLGVSQVLVSLDGSNAETHESLRRVPGCWEKAIRGIRSLKKAGVVVIANTVINRQNMSDLVNMPPLLAELNVDVWRLGTLFYVGRSKKDDPTIDLSLEQEIEILSILDQKYFKERWPFNLTTTIDWESMIISDAELADRKHICGMTMGKHWYIRANGDVLVCDRLPNLVVGNIRQSSLKELWGSRLIRQWKFKTVDKLSKCRECRLRYLCGGGCRANAKLHTGSYFTHDPVACQTMQCSVVKRWNQFPTEIRDRLSHWIIDE